MVSRIRNGTARPLLALVVLVTYLTMPGLGFGGVPTALAQTDDLQRAREHYEFAEFDQALAILDGMIAAGGQSDERMRDAQVLRARCHVGLGNANLAEEAFCEALAIDPDWRPDPVFFPRSEVEVFERARAACPEPMAEEPAEPVVEAVPTPAREAQSQSTAWYKKPLVWVGAAAAVVVAAVALGGGGDDGDDGPGDLPPPPDPPDQTK
ncbi:hypothetical protein GF314_02985 [bacterium]|nr:hypothetical protein [bacterium]